MKKLILTIAALGALTFTAVAQDANRTTKAGTELSPEQKADKETTKVAGALSLSDAQKATFKKLALERFTANKPLREKAQASTDKTEKQNLRNQVKSNNEKFFASVNSMLTPEQQTKWADHRKKVEAKQKDKANQND